MAKAAIKNGQRHKTAFKAAIYIGILTAFIALVTALPAKEWGASALAWIEEIGPLGYAVFVLLYAAFTVSFIPGFILTLGGGAVFGLWGGFAAVSIGSTVGAAFAFLLGRGILRNKIESKIQNNQKFSAVDRAIGKQGWKIVFLTRLSPVFPFNLINYAYGLTKIRFRDYVLASWIGMMPGTFVYVYMGSLLGDVARIFTGDKAETGTLELVLQVAGLIATFAVTVYVTRIAKKALEEEAEL